MGAPLSRSVRVGLPAAVFAVTATCFLPTLGNDFVNWDDGALILTNIRYRGLSPAHLQWMFTTTVAGHYQPLTWITLGMDYVMWGMNPRGYHLTSLLVHAASAMLFYFLILALLRAAGRMDGVPLRWAAAIGALFYSIHPLRVESVAWATERRDVLSGLFCLLSLLAYVRMQPEAGRRWWMWCVASVGCFAASLLSKAWGMTLPVVLLALDAYPLRRFVTSGGVRPVIEKIPYAILAVAAAIVAALAQGRTGSMIPFGQYTLAQRVAQAFEGLCFYPLKTMMPVDLSPLYLFDRNLSPLAIRYVLSFLAVAGVTGVVVALRRRWPAALTAWLCYAVMVSPVVGFAQTGPQAVADRYSYLSCLPFAVGIAWLALQAWERRMPADFARLCWAVAACVLGTLGLLTAAQTRVWKDSLTLWNHALRLNPRNTVAYASRGNARHVAGDYEGAMEDYNEALRSNPNYPEARSGRAMTKLVLGDFKGAIEDADVAVRLVPDRARLYVQRGLARLELGDTPGAVDDFDTSLRLDPFLADAHNNRGLARKKLGDVPGAIADFTEAARLATGDRPKYLTNRGLARQEQSDLRGALADFDQVLHEDPRYVRGYGSRAAARIAAGDVRGAVADLDACIRLEARSPQHHQNRGTARAMLGDLAGAAEDYGRALELAPPDWPLRTAVEGQLAQVRRRLGGDK